MGFSRQEFWSGLPCPPARGLLNPGIEPPSLRSPALAGGFFTSSAPWEARQSPLAIIILYNQHKKNPDNKHLLTFIYPWVGGFPAGLRASLILLLGPGLTQHLLLLVKTDGSGRKPQSTFLGFGHTMSASVSLDERNVQAGQGRAECKHLQMTLSHPGKASREPELPPAMEIAAASSPALQSTLRTLLGP